MPERKLKKNQRIPLKKLMKHKIKQQKKKDKLTTRSRENN